MHTGILECECTHWRTFETTAENALPFFLMLEYLNIRINNSKGLDFHLMDRTTLWGQLVRWTDKGLSTKLGDVWVGKTPEMGMSCWKPVLPPSCSEGKRDVSRSCMMLWNAANMPRHMGWWSLMRQSGSWPCWRRNCSKSWQYGSKCASEKGGSALSDPAWAMKILSRRLSQ